MAELYEPLCFKRTRQFLSYVAIILKGSSFTSAPEFHEDSVTSPNTVEGFLIVRRDQSCNLTYKLSRESDQFIHSCIYNAPAVGVKKFIADMETILTFLNEYSELSCIVGDMNIDLLKNSPEHRQYMSIVNGNGYTQLINEATRITDKSKTLLDHVLIKKYDEGIVSSGVINTAITDHCATYVELPCLTSNPQAPKRRNMVFLYSKDKFNAFSEKVETFFDNSWRADIENISDKCSFLISDLNLIIDEFSKIETPRRKSNSPPWYNNYLRNLITKGKKLYLKYTLDRSRISYNGFRLYRTKVLKAIKKEKRIYYDNLFNNCLKDKREFFCNLNNVTGRTCKQTIKKIISDEHEYEKPEEIVEKFNEYFSRIGQTINQQIENCTESYSINETEFSMFLKSTNIPEVKKVIDNLNAHKSAGIDGIPADVIKNCSDIFAPLLTVWSIYHSLKEHSQAA